MKKIKLTKNKYVLVDNEDFVKLNKFKWYCDNRGYATRAMSRKFAKLKGIKRGKILMAREIMNAKNRMQVDHINHNTLDNRKKNLRICTLQENSFNRLKSKNNKSGFTGVDWFKQTRKWRVTIRINKKSSHLGYFTNKKDAIKCRKIAIKKYYKIKNNNL